MSSCSRITYITQYRDVKRIQVKHTIYGIMHKSPRSLIEISFSSKKKLRIVKRYE